MSAKHYIGDAQFSACGTWARCATTSTPDRTAVTCKRCLGTLAKRDRAFQKAASNWYGIVEPRFPKLHRMARARIAEEAIAREEGRPL